VESVVYRDGDRFYRGLVQGLDEEPRFRKVVMRYVMEPLEKEEIKDYIKHKLRETGAKTPIFASI
jgi:type II secretory pathway predicted ATPase ExeA